MKHLDLKSIGDSCKKMLYKGTLLIGIAATCCLSACSDDDENSAVPVFPELQSISCNAGETKDFSFEANTNWSLTTSEMWCKFVKDGVESFALSGNAGSQTVTISVTDEASSVDEASVAHLELTMGTQSVIIGEVIRSAKGSKLTVYDEAGTEIQQLTVGYGEFIPFKVQANFHFAATSLPSWIELEGGSLVGASDKVVESGLRVVQNDQDPFAYDYDKYPVTADKGEVIVFTDSEGKASFSIPVIYAGMDPNTINKEFPEGTSHAYNWSVSMDGTNFAQDAGSGSSTSGATFTGHLSYRVKALNDQYKFVFGTPTTIGGMDFSTSSDWINITDDGKGNIALTANAGTEERTIYVLVFSQAQFDAFQEDYTAIWNGEDIADNYQYNLLIQLTQRNTESGTAGQLFGESTYYNASYQILPLETSLLYGGDRLNHYKSAFGVSSVLEVTKPTDAQTLFITINYLLNTTGQGWIVYDSEENPTTAVSVEMASMDEENGTMSMMIPVSTLESEILVVFTEAAEENPRKVMVVVHPTSQSSGGEEEGDRLVLTSIMGESISCTPYELGDAEDLKSAYGCESIWISDTPESTMVVSLSSGTKIDVAGVKMYHYEWGTTVFEELENTNGEIENDYMGGIMLYSGNEYGVSNLFGKDVFIVIPGEDGKKYGLTYAYWGTF